VILQSSVEIKGVATLLEAESDVRLTTCRGIDERETVAQEYAANQVHTRNALKTVGDIPPFPSSIRSTKYRELSETAFPHQFLQRLSPFNGKIKNSNTVPFSTADGPSGFTTHTANSRPEPWTQRFDSDVELVSKQDNHQHTISTR
jgi:hypothetical protein